MAVNTDRFEKIGDSARYVDRWSGQEVSYRFAISATIGMSPERYASLNRAAYEAGFQGAKVVPAESRARMLESWLSSHGVKVRGEKAADFKAFKADLEKEKKLAAKDPRGGQWVNKLVKKYGKLMKGFDWDAFFGSPGGRKH